MRNTHRIKIVSLAVAAALGLSACNNGGDTTTSAGSDTVTSGVITGFGSVYVNGVRFSTDNATISIDGTPMDESALKVGMVVTLEGSVNPDGTGQALAIRFADEVDGEVLANNVAVDGTLSIMGQTVHIDTDTVFESFDPNQLTPTDIQVGNIVEVSGFSSGDGNIYATRIEVKKAQREAGDELSLKGVIANLDTAAQTFQIGQQTIDYSNANLDGLTEPQNGLFVEVKSTDGFANGVLIASEIELEDDGDKRMELPEGEDLEISGAITKIIDAAKGLVEINGQPVQLDGAELEGLALADLARGLKIKVEGKVNAEGILVAEEAKAKPKGELEMAARVESVDPVSGTITLTGGVEVKITNETLKRDDSSKGEKYFDINDLAQNDWLEVKLYQEADGTWVALKLERDDAEPTDPMKIEGSVQIDPSNSTQIQVGPLTLDLSGMSSPAPAMNNGDKVEMSFTVDTNGQLMVQQIEMDD